LLLSFVGSTSASERQNVLLISLDTLRPDHLPFYGYSRQTAPNLTELAESGVIFMQAYSTSSWTLPAHGSVFTGLYPWEHGLVRPDLQLLENVPAIAESLSESGYECAAFVSGYTLHSAFGFSRGFELYDDFSVHGLSGILSGRNAVEPKEQITSPIITRLALRWLARARERPFFLFLHYFDVHDHYLPPEGYKDRFDPEYMGSVDGRIENEHTPKHYSTRDIEHLIALYDGEIAWVDHHLGILFEQLKSLGLFETTTILVFSDHGEGFGQHGTFRHGNSLHEELVRCLLLIHSPSLSERGTESDVPVSLVQVYDTLEEIANLPRTNNSRKSLFELLRSKEESVASPTNVLGSLDVHTPGHFIRKGPWKLIQTDDHSQLYNLSTDPSEKQDLAEAHPDRVQDLQESFLHLQSSKPSTHHRGKQPLPTEILFKLRDLGYF